MVERTHVAMVIMLIMILTLIVLCFGLNMTANYPVFRLTTKEFRKKLYDLTHEVTTVLEANNIKYSAAFGTALGMARQDGILIFDDDVDIFIHENDHAEVKRIFTDDPAFSVRPQSWTGVQVCNNGICVDLFTLTTKDDNVHMKSSQDGKMLVEHWNALSKQPFGPYEIYAVTSIREHVAEQFGKDWETVAIVKPMHGPNNEWWKNWRLFKNNDV